MNLQFIFLSFFDKTTTSYITISEIATGKQPTKSMKPLILNIETSTEVCSVCISKGEKIIAINETDKNFVHAEMITLFIEQCLSTAKLEMKDLDAVAVSSGPGSYTGLRVGTSVAKGICYALDKPIISIDTLQSLAIASFEEIYDKNAIYCPMIDARRMEVYSSIFNSKGNNIAKTKAIILNEHSFSEYFDAGKKIIFSGNGAKKCMEVIKSPLAKFSSIVCSSKHLAQLSYYAFQKKDFVDLAYYSPYYFKSPNITKSKKRGIL